MKELLSKKDQRHLTLIEVLYRAQYWHTYSTLAKELGCSVRILKDDIHDLNEEHDDFELETSYEGVRLVFKPNKGIQGIYREFLLRSKAFDLFQLIFTNESYTTEELATLLFISTSTLRRLIKKAQKYLMENFELSIQSNPYRYMGDEKDIRYFCFQLFAESFPNHKWAIDDVDSEELDIFLKSFHDKIDLSLPYTTMHYLKIVVSVNSIRYKQQHKIKQMNTTEQSRQDLATFFSDTDTRSLNHPFPFELDEEAFLQLFFPFSTFWYLKNTKHLENSLKINGQLKASHHYLSKWLKHLSVEHQVPLPNMDELLLDLHNLNYFYEKPVQTKSLLFDQRKNFIDSIQKNYPILYRQLYNGLTIYRKKMNQFTTKTIVDYLIHLLFTHWHNLLPKLQEKTEDSVQLLIFSVTDVNHARMIKDYLTYHFRNHLTIDLHTENYLTMEDLPNLPYDIVVSNAPLPDIPSSLCICIETLPTPNDMHVIQETMKDIRLERLNYQA